MSSKIFWECKTQTAFTKPVCGDTKGELETSGAWCDTEPFVIVC